MPFSTPPSPLSCKRRRLDSLAAGEVASGHGPPSLAGATFTDDETVPSEGRGSPSLDVILTPDRATTHRQPATPPRPSPPCLLPAPPFIRGMSPPTELTPRTKRSYAMVEAESHAVRLRVSEREGADKTTKRIYDRVLINYCTWWDQDQARVVARDPNRVAIPALPVTAPKVVLFLDYEMNRERRKVCYGSVLVSRLG